MAMAGIFWYEMGSFLEGKLQQNPSTEHSLKTELSLDIKISHGEQFVLYFKTIYSDELVHLSHLGYMSDKSMNAFNVYKKEGKRNNPVLIALDVEKSRPNNEDE